MKEKVRNMAVGLVLAGKWDFLPHPNLVGFLFLVLGWCVCVCVCVLRFTRELCESLLPCCIWFFVFSFGLGCVCVCVCVCGVCVLDWCVCVFLRFTRELCESLLPCCISRG